MAVVKWIGYLIAATVVLGILFAVGSVLSALVFGIAVVVSVIALIGFIAYCIKDYVESTENRP